jgi:hypothetical protein
MARPLFVTHQNVADRRINEWVVGRQNRSPRQTKHNLGVFHFKALDEGLGSSKFHFILAPGLIFLT